MYYGIVLDASKYGVKTSTQGYVVGYGFVIPLALWLPFQILEYLDLRGIGFRLGLVCLPMTVTLRCLESMYGFVDANKISLWDYVLASGFILKPYYDQNGKPCRLTLQQFGDALSYHVVWLLSFAVMNQILQPFHYFPFPSSVKAPNEIWVSFDIGHLYNTFIQAFLINTTLAFSVSGVSMLAALYSGVAFDGYITKNPMFLSTSPSDFWGRRWNNLIHLALKQGVYKPVRWNTGNRTLASVAVFVVSGLYHELVWKILFTPTSAQLSDGMQTDVPSCCKSCYCHGWIGKQLLFFSWNGALIALEYAIGDRIGQWTKPLPQWLQSHLVVLLSLPVGHLFTADVTMSGYFDSLRQSLPLFVIQKITQ